MGNTNTYPFSLGVVALVISNQTETRAGAKGVVTIKWREYRPQYAGLPWTERERTGGGLLVGSNVITGTEKKVKGSFLEKS